MLLHSELHPNLLEAN